jgi:hypothetical protein
MVLIRFISNVKEGTCSFIFMDEDSIGVPTYYMVENYTATVDYENSVVEKSNSNVTASTFVPGTGFVVDEKITSSISELLVLELMKICNKFYLGSYSNMGREKNNVH